jgi:thiosulfate/3-mercaptopyruvate sulfurtransferase
LVDTRSAARFNGEVDEKVMPNLRRGSVKNSLNLPFSEVLNEDGTFRNPELLEKAFADLGVSVGSEKKVIFTCGTGMTACIVDVAFQLMGEKYEGTRIYDNSWAEYGGVPEPKFE